MKTYNVTTKKENRNWHFRTGMDPVSVLRYSFEGECVGDVLCNKNVRKNNHKTILASANAHIDNFDHVTIIRCIYKGDAK